MKIEKEFRDDHQVKLTVVIDSDPYERAKRIAARKIAKSVKIPGFRPGKAPYNVIVRTVGEGAIVEQAIETLIDEEYPKIIEAADIKPYGPGTLETVSELDPPTFEFIVPLEPEVELGDYKSISLAYEVPQISDAEVNETLERIQEQNATRESVERPAEIGDLVFMQISAKNLEPETEEDAEIVKERFSSSKIEAETNELEWPFPGFARQLVGIEIQQERSIRHEYPEDFSNEEFAGINAEFHVVVTNIQSQTLPAIDDELAQTASEYDTLEEWKTNLKENLAAQAVEEYKTEYDEQILDLVVAGCTVKFPPQMVENEKEEMLRGLEYNLSRQGLSKELYLQIRGLDEAGLLEEITPAAETRVRRSLVLMEIAQAEEIQADPQVVNSELGRTFEAIAQSMTPNEAKKLAKSNYMPMLASNIVADMLSQKTVEYLRATAKGEPWPLESESEEESGEAAEEEETQSDAAASSPEAEVEDTEATPEESEETPPKSEE